MEKLSYDRRGDKRRVRREREVIRGERGE